jgi:hypothetical protein
MEELLNASFSMRSLSYQLFFSCNPTLFAICTSTFESKLLFLPTSYYYKPNAWGCNWDILFLGEINTVTWSSRLGESKKIETKLCSWVPWDSDPRKTALAMASNIWKLRTRPLVRKGVLHQHNRNCLKNIAFPKSDISPTKAAPTYLK